MNTPQQFRLAADILEKGLPWQEQWDGVFIDAEGESTLWECLRSEREIRLKPWSLSRHIPGFRPLRDGEEWHRTDWTEEMLPEGWRPLLKGEDSEKGDLYKRTDGNEWEASVGWSHSSMCEFYRTKRPLPEPKKRVPWDDTSDFPKVPVVWIRSKNDYREHKVIGFAHPCAIITATCGCEPVLQSIHLEQDGFKDMEWSEDRKSWAECIKGAS